MIAVTHEAQYYHEIDDAGLFKAAMFVNPTVGIGTCIGKHHSIAQEPGMKEQVIIANGVSKAFLIGK